MMLEVSLGNIIVIVTGLLAAMAGAIGVMFKWILGKFKDLENALGRCHDERLAMVERTAKLEGRLEELDRYNPSAMLEQFTKTVTELLQK